jgi:hypothetical protein
MIRVVLDTNIIVSALLQPTGPPARIFTLVLGDGLQLCVSAGIYAEYEEVISRPRLQRSQETIASTLQAIRGKAFGCGRRSAYGLVRTRMTMFSWNALKQHELIIW